MRRSMMMFSFFLVVDNLDADAAEVALVLEVDLPLALAAMTLDRADVSIVRSALTPEGPGRTGE